MNNELETLIVAAALIEENSKILICQRKENDTFGFMWEFPGGVVEEGETLERAIRREIKEELDIEVCPVRFINGFEDRIDSRKITVFLFECKKIRGELAARDCRDFKFATLKEISGHNLAPVDRKILDYLKVTRKKPDDS